MAVISIAGVASFSIDGNPYDLAGDFEYEPNIDENTTIGGLTGVSGYAVSPKAGKISTTIRDNASIDVTSFSQMTSVTISAQLRNGKSVLGTAMWVVGSVTVDGKEASIKLTFEGKSVSEY